MDEPLRVRPGLEIPLGEIDLRTSRSSGPGGQHANVTESRVEASFDIYRSQALGDRDRERLVARYGDRVKAVAQDARSQARNRELALERLREKIGAALVPVKPRRPTRPGSGARERRLREKKRRGEIKQARRPPEPD